MRLKAQLGVLLCGLAGFVVLGVVPALVAKHVFDGGAVLMLAFMVVMACCVGASWEGVKKAEKRRRKKDE